MSAAPSAAAELRDCGFEEALHGENLNREGRQCFMDAFAAGEAAQFVSRGVTVEGAPISRTYVFDGDGAVNVFHDARQDPLGSGQIELISCGRLVGIDEWNRANGSNRSPDEVFVEDNCEYLGTQ